MSFVTSTVDRVLAWSRANSLNVFAVSGGCCADEVLQAFSCRYDLERFGCVAQADPRHADLLLVSGAVTRRMAEELRAVYDQMLFPKYVMAIGTCGTSGGAFTPQCDYAVHAGLQELMPVDVYVPGCPPRPEAIMNGLMLLQEKIKGERTVGSRPTAQGV